jgi:hypothetical protein
MRKVIHIKSSLECVNRQLRKVIKPLSQRSNRCSLLAPNTSDWRGTADAPKARRRTRSTRTS